MIIKHKPKPMIGVHKRETKFLLFPIRIENETRWLSRETIEYVYTEYTEIEYTMIVSEKKWIPIQFIN